MTHSHFQCEEIDVIGGGMFDRVACDHNLCVRLSITTESVDMVTCKRCQRTLAYRCAQKEGT